MNPTNPQDTDVLQIHSRANAEGRSTSALAPSEGHGPTSPCPPSPVGLPGVQMAGCAGTRGKCVTSKQKQASPHHFSGMRSVPLYVAPESGCLRLSQRSTVHSCYLERNFFLAASMGTLARKSGRFLLSCFPIHISS